MLGNKPLQILYRACFMLSIPAVQIFYFVLNNYRSNVRSIGTVLDDMIPFMEIFIIPYVYWYAYVFLTLVFFLFADHRYYYRLLASITTATIICLFIYYFFPTTVSRPEVLGDDVFSNMVKWIYSNDNPYNCFPSLHVLDTVLPTLFLMKYTKNRFVQVFVIISAVSITLSTLFIKQHYIWDAVASIVIGVAVYMFYTNEYLWSRFSNRRIPALIRLVRIKVLAK